MKMKRKEILEKQIYPKNDLLFLSIYEIIELIIFKQIKKKNFQQNRKSLPYSAWLKITKM